jgi:DNA-directed RNA polymerase subunit RPC12/RpoP
MTPSLSFRCPGCNARIRAPAPLLGQYRNCPGCGERILIRVQVPEEAEPLLVPDERVSKLVPSFR